MVYQLSCWPACPACLLSVKSGVRPALMHSLAWHAAEGKLEQAVAEASQATAQLQQLGPGGTQAAAAAAAAAAGALPEVSYNFSTAQAPQVAQQPPPTTTPAPTSDTITVVYETGWGAAYVHHNVGERTSGLPGACGVGHCVSRQAAGGQLPLDEVGWEPGRGLGRLAHGQRPTGTMQASAHAIISKRRASRLPLADGAGWTTVPGTQMQNGTQQFPDKKVLTVVRTAPAPSTPCSPKTLELRPPPVACVLLALTEPSRACLGRRFGVHMSTRTPMHAPSCSPPGCLACPPCPPAAARAAHGVCDQQRRQRLGQAQPVRLLGLLQLCHHRARHVPHKKRQGRPPRMRAPGCRAWSCSAAVEPRVFVSWTAMPLLVRSLGWHAGAAAYPPDPSMLVFCPLLCLQV